MNKKNRPQKVSGVESYRRTLRVFLQEIIRKCSLARKLELCSHKFFNNIKCGSNSLVATSIQPSFSIVSTSPSAPSVEVEMDPNGTPIFYATSASTNVLANSRRDVLVNSLGGHHFVRRTGGV